MTDIQIRYETKKRERCEKLCRLVYRGIPYNKVLSYCEERCALQHG